jgi:hypothetical protein
MINSYEICCWLIDLYIIYILIGREREKLGKIDVFKLEKKHIKSE